MSTASGNNLLGWFHLVCFKVAKVSFSMNSQILQLKTEKVELGVAQPTANCSKNFKTFAILLPFFHIRIINVFRNHIFFKF